MSWVERPKEIRQKIKCLGAGAGGVPEVTFCLRVHMSLFLALLNIEDNSSMHLCFAMLNKKKTLYWRILFQFLYIVSCFQ